MPVGAGVVDRDDARVVEASQQGALSLEARSIEPSSLDQLDRDLALEGGVVGEVDPAGSAFTQQLGQLVAADLAEVALVAARREKRRADEANAVAALELARADAA